MTMELPLSSVYLTQEEGKQTPRRRKGAYPRLASWPPGTLDDFLPWERTSLGGVVLRGWWGDASLSSVAYYAFPLATRSHDWKKLGPYKCNPILEPHAGLWKFLKSEN